MSERMVVEIAMDQAWRYASGAAMERFCASLKNREIETLRCGGCGRRMLPPRPFCGNCRRRLEDWVPVRDSGVLKAWTVVHLPILDASSGTVREAPYGMGLIQLDGADTTLNHYLDRNDPAQLKIGMRVRAVWKVQRRGAMDDILHFEVME